jgi:predicted glycoside hydrolase/deacetylase ChbG (UPF0249 family)
MKRLIVNADDLGADECRNIGIFEGIHCGVVTSVSILPNGFALDNALQRIRCLQNRRISCGLHFNVSEGKPLCEGLKHLVGQDGSFLGKRKARHLLAGAPSQEVEDELQRELSAQIMRLRDAEIFIVHIDGHQHAHCFPAVLKIVVSAALAHEIPWIRIADEQPTSCIASALSANELEEAVIFSRHAQSARIYAQEAGLRAPDQFRGLYFKGRLPASNWVEFLENLPSGITELMVHPGRAESGVRSPFSGFSTPDRENELRALTDGRFMEALSKTGVELTPFPEAPIC